MPARLLGCACLLAALAAAAPDYSPAVLVLDATAKVGSLSVDGHSKLIVRRGGLAVNSSETHGALFNSNSTILAANGGAVSLVGKYMALGNATCVPAPTPGEVVANPFAALKLPPPGEQLSSRRRIIPGGQRVTLRPGTYRGGVLVCDKCDVTLAPGVYHFVDGDLAVLAANLTGDGVCLLFTGEKAGQLALSNDCTCKLTAPAEGDLAGLAVVSLAKEAAVSFNACRAEVQGTLYAPNGLVQSLFKADATVSRVVSAHVTLNVDAKLVVTGEPPKPPAAPAQ